MPDNISRGARTTAEGSKARGIAVWFAWGSTRKQMVLDTVGATVETTVASQFPEMVSEGDL
jgi:hypothetical protein